jgi:4'-phosphopantetheinyl transferase
MLEPVIWLAPPSDLQLNDDEVHLWKADLDTASENISVLFDLLNEEEQSRAKRFVFERDKNRFTAARGILRQLLARYVNCSAKDVEFTVGPAGKPALRHNSQLRFNLSHSEGLVLYALSLGRELGVDVENQIKESTNREIVERYFSAEEQADFLAIDPALQEAAFYLGWTRKEAYLKARGEGLQGRLKDFDMSLSPKQPAVLRSDDAGCWDLYSFCPKLGFIATLVVERGKGILRHWEWREDGTVLH